MGDERKSEPAAKREALKSAGKENVPNLLVARLKRQRGVAARQVPTPWGVIGFFIALLLGVAWFAQRSPYVRAGWKSISGPHLAPTAVAISSGAAGGFEVAQSSPASLRAPESSGAVPALAVSSGTVNEGAPALVEATSTAGTAQWSGNVSNTREARELVVRGRAAWRTLWEEIGQPSPAPHVNFNEMVVVAIFAGERPAGHYRISLESPIDQDDAVILPYRVKGPLTAVEGAKGPVTPFLLTTVPRSPKPIRLRPEES